MLCPTCTDTQLVLAERGGVEIDYCPKCRGIWLDRGELDKLIERSAAMSPQPPMGTPRAPQSMPQQPPMQQPMQRRYDDDDDDDRYRDGRQQPHYRKRKGWLGELLDFD
jgi:uncharacterized protein